MFKIRIIYDETIDNEYFTEAIGIMYINCRKSIGFSLDIKKKKFHHSFCHKYVVPEYLFVLDHSVKQKHKF